VLQTNRSSDRSRKLKIQAVNFEVLGARDLYSELGKWESVHRGGSQRREYFSTNGCTGSVSRGSQSDGIRYAWGTGGGFKIEGGAMRAGYANRRLRIRMHGSIHDPTAGIRQEVVACQNRCRRVSLVTTLAKDLPSSVYMDTHVYTRGRVIVLY